MHLRGALSSKGGADAKPSHRTTRSSSFGQGSLPYIASMSTTSTPINRPTMPGSWSTSRISSLRRAPSELTLSAPRMDMKLVEVLDTLPLYFRDPSSAPDDPRTPSVSLLSPDTQQLGKLTIQLAATKGEHHPQYHGGIEAPSSPSPVSLARLQRPKVCRLSRSLRPFGTESPRPRRRCWSAVSNSAQILDPRVLYFQRCE